MNSEVCVTSDASGYTEALIELALFGAHSLVLSVTFFIDGILVWKI